MKSAPGLLLLLLLAAGPALADVNYNKAIGQAKRAVNQTEAASGNLPATPGQAAPPAADPKLQATLQNIGDLQADFTGICADADVTAAEDQKISLLNHLAQAAQGTKVDSAAVKKLAGDFIGALAGKKLPPPQTQRLAQAVHALFNSAHLSAPQTEQTLAEVETIFAAGKVSAEAGAKTMGDLKAIAAATK